jgi:hypothetical protein
MILEFGKFKGQDVEDVPLTYIIFLAGFKMHGEKRVRSDLQACKWVQTHTKEVHEFAKNYLADLCWHCAGKLKPVGSSRKNGAAHDDWNDRYLHKRCWLELKKESSS